MTLEEALAVYLYYLVDKDEIGEREERILDAAWEIIEQNVRRILESGSLNRAPLREESAELVTRVRAINKELERTAGAAEPDPPHSRC